MGNIQFPKIVLCGVTILVFALVCFSTQSMFGQETEFQPGDEVEVKLGRNVARGELVKKQPLADVWFVRIQVMGSMVEMPFPAANIRRVKGAKKKQTNGENKEKSQPTNDPGELSFRTWTDSQGKHEIEAALISYDRFSQTVTLQKKDGQTIDVPLQKLSQQDRIFLIRRDAQKTKREIKAADFFVENDPRAKVNELAPVPFAANPVELRSKKWDFTAEAATDPPAAIPGKTVDILEAISPAPGVPEKVAKYHSVPGLIGNQPNFKGALSQFVMSDDGKSWAAIVGHRFGHQIANSATEKSSFLHADLVSGKVVLETVSGNVIANSPKRSLVAVVEAAKTHHDQSRIVVRKIDDADNVIREFPVKAFHDHSGYDPNKGFFLNDSILVTIGERLVAFDVDTGKGYCTTRFPDGHIAATRVSPNKKHVAIAFWEEIFFFDAARGKPIGEIHLGENSYGDICFSPNGNKLAALTKLRPQILIYDLATGKLEQTIETENAKGSSLAWPDDRLILIDNEQLVDVEQEVTVWQYELSGRPQPALGHLSDDRFVYVSDFKATAVQIPHNELRAKIDSFDWEDAIALEEGDQVSLQMDLPFPEDEKEQIREHFLKSLASHGIQLVQSSSNVFKLFVEPESEKTVSVGRVGAMQNSQRDAKNRQKVKITPFVYHIDLVENGKTRWSKSHRTFSGNALVLDKKQSVQESLEFLSKPRFDYFRSAKLPNKFVKFPGGGDSFGKSTITHDGNVSN